MSCIRTLQGPRSGLGAFQGAAALHQNAHLLRAQRRARGTSEYEQLAGECGSLHILGENDCVLVRTKGRHHDTYRRRGNEDRQVLNDKLCRVCNLASGPVDMHATTPSCFSADVIGRPTPPQAQHAPVSESFCHLCKATVTSANSQGKLRASEVTACRNSMTAQ